MDCEDAMMLRHCTNNELERENKELREIVDWYQSHGNMVTEGIIKIIVEKVSNNQEKVDVIQDIVKMFSAWRDGCIQELGNLQRAVDKQ